MQNRHEKSTEQRQLSSATNKRLFDNQKLLYVNHILKRRNNQWRKRHVSR